MSQDTRSHYEFGTLPIAPVQPGTSLLVAGPALAGTRELALRMLRTVRQDEGVLFIGADESGTTLLEEYTTQGGTFDRGRMAAIECDAPSGESDDQNIRTVGSPGDLTGIGIEYSSLYEGLHREGVERVRTGLFTVSTLLMYAEEIQPVYRFLHTLTGRIQSADGVGVCVVDPTTQDDQTLNSITQTFDGRIDLRETDDGKQIRVRGLPDQASDWQPL